jgi:hypothetical protein
MTYSLKKLIRIDGRLYRRLKHSEGRQEHYEMWETSFQRTSKPIWWTSETMPYTKVEKCATRMGSCVPRSVGTCRTRVSATGSARLRRTVNVLLVAGQRTGSVRPGIFFPA